MSLRGHSGPLARGRGWAATRIGSVPNAAGRLPRAHGLPGAAREEDVDLRERPHDFSHEMLERAGPQKPGGVPPAAGKDDPSLRAEPSSRTAQQSVWANVLYLYIHRICALAFTPDFYPRCSP